jgi:hypothetical protein
MWYALPDDDRAPTATTITASAEDPGYPAEWLVTENPAQPAKLTTTSGSWVLEFASPVTLAAVALIYPQLDAGIGVTLEGNSTDSWGAPAFSQAIINPGPHPDGQAISPIAQLTGSPSYPFWRLRITGTNSVPVAVGRLMLLSSLRTIGNGISVRWGVVEEEDYGIVEMATELGVDLIYDVGGKRRELLGEMLLREDETQDFLALWRATHGRVQSWLLWPFPEVNDVYVVRWSQRTTSRRLDVPDPDGGYVQLVRCQVKELSRGLPWP